MGSSREREPLGRATTETERLSTLFDRVISPLSRDEFLTRFWRQSFVRVPGQKGRLASVFSWRDLNWILEHDRTLAYTVPGETPRFSLFRDGKSVDPLRYSSRHGGTIQLRPASLVNLLSEGATLILNSVEALVPSVREVSEAFEDALHARTAVNLYGDWRTQKGFDLHWDPQDTMILQLSGRKHWKVYRPTRLHPLLGETEQTQPPTEEPIWDGILEDGDMIYLPRGWWHVAFPLDEPSLHLTVTMVPANGTDLLRWFVEGLRKHAEVRMNLPDPASAAERKQYVLRMRELLLEQWDENVLDRFLAEWNSLPLRPQVRLPESPIECREPIAAETRVRLATTDRLSFLPGAKDKVSFSANGVWWECAASLAPPLEQLRNKTAYSIQELCAALPDPSAAPKLRFFLTTLVMGGVLWTESPDAPPQTSHRRVGHPRIGR